MHTARRIVAGLGRSFISVGVLVLLFVMYELYGTSIQESRAQDTLKNDLKKSPVTTPSNLLPTTPVTLLPPPPPGEALATIKIDKLGLFKAVVEGVDTNDLKKGPGHYAGTPLPGEAGNVAIAGHRTTYGAPFYRVNELVAGDPIVVTTKQGSFTYKVRDQKVVSPDANEVLNNTPDNVLTLTTCHPRFSAAQRLIITATLEGDPIGTRDLSTYGAGGPAMVGDEGGSSPAGGAPAPAGTPNTTVKSGIGVVGGLTNPPPNSATVTSAPGAKPEGQDAGIRGGVSGHGVARGPAIQWGIIAALVALLTYLASRRWRKWPAYALGAPVFLLVLYVFFENFASLLPANV